MAKLLGLEYSIHYKKGSENRVADALSRQMDGDDNQLMAITTLVPSWLKEVPFSYDGDERIMKLMKELLLQDDASGVYSLQRGLLYYKKRLYIGPSSNIRDKLIQACHDSRLGGHSGIRGTLLRVKQHFYWPSMQDSINEWVSKCDTCLRCKPEQCASPGSLQPLPVATGAWQAVSLDFVEGLPKSHGFDTVLVVVDRFTKYSHFIPLTHPYTAKIVARVFLDNVFKLHGLPASIVSDRDRIFTGLFWRELMQLLGTQLLFSSAYHPQTDGQSERVNQCMENYLKCMCFLVPKQWAKWLALAEFWYNSS